jgi:hypothetical protein
MSLIAKVLPLINVAIWEAKNAAPFHLTAYKVATVAAALWFGP